MILISQIVFVSIFSICLRSARTIFLPKVPDTSNPADFRPITVAPILVRLYHRILASRVLATTDFDHSQRAFLPVDGCAENVAILSTVLHEARTKR